ncbi:EAL domain-containing protein [Idiomarina xiamenensis]|uniref:Intracellular signaling protein n=1 Tax=Idiomarina xiamenensis 10-D-4 TaxID=740709 RepID=K2JJ50_9GAMM|nr:EAL domain-containing protein [Idiomarina xiamenensis]EKE83451.1 intracellular signaling protein [Idiomarina xiamenensis 10-D-4]
MSKKQDSVYPADNTLHLRKVIERLKKLTVKYRQAEVVQKALFRISELAASVRNMSDFYSAVHAIIGELMAAKNFYICLYDQQRDWVNFVYFVDEYDEMDAFSHIPMEQLSRGITGYVLRTGEPLLCTNEIFQDLIARGEVESYGASHVYWLGVPLISGDSVLGAMVVQSYDEQVRYDENNKELLTFVSQHVVNALERLKQREMLQAEIEHQTAELRHANESLMKEITVREKAELQTSVLFAISELTNTSEDMHSFYASLHAEIGKLLHAENFYVALQSEDRKYIYFPYHVDEVDGDAQRRRLSKGLTEYVIRQGKACFIDDEKRTQLVRDGEIILGSEHGRMAKQWLGSPLVLDGDVFGVLAVQSYDEEFLYQHDDLELLNFVSQHVAVAIERKRTAEEITRVNVFLEKKVAERTEELVSEIERRKKVEAKLFHDAHHDTLTGLPNRALFSQRLQQAVSHKRRHPEHNFAVLFVDLDRFKNINDTLGHSAGDQFLLEVSQRLHDCVRDNDMLARLGGDEFVILLDTIGHIEDAKEVAARVIDKMRQPFVLDGNEHYSGASIGIAECQSETDSAERLLRDADAAMYQAKNLGRGRFVLFDDSIHQGLVESIHQETALRQAQFNQDFVLHHQPIYNLFEDTIVGYEALVRWQRNGEELAPERFLDLAERSGIVVEIDRWVLRRCCEYLLTRQEKQLSTPRLHINLSIRHLLKSANVRELQLIIDEHGIDPKQLVFEFNETSLLQDGRRLLSSMRHLSQFGVGLALDDFGRGSGPLQFIYNYPFDIIKLDNQFIAQLTHSERAQAMVRNVVQLCEELKIDTYAEGIESDQQRILLESLGVRLGQGNLLGEVRRLKSPINDLSACA